MYNEEALIQCRHCGHHAPGKYCGDCGEALHIHRITLGHMLHEVVHLITHFDKGFAYTLKMLITKPGFMEAEYIAGKRSSYQKPFSMFFVCGTLTALGLYWLNTLIGKMYGDHDLHELHFYQHYFVMIQMCLVPVYALVNRVAYINTSYNYAEFLVILLYNTSLIFLFVLLANAFKLITGPFETGYLEMVFVLIYNLFTYINFFGQDNKWIVGAKVIITSAVCFALSRFAMETFIHTFLS